MTRPSAMPRPKTDNAIQLTVNVSEEVRDRIDALTSRGAGSMPGLVLSRADVMRAALLRGLDSLESEHPADAKTRKR